MFTNGNCQFLHILPVNLCLKCIPETVDLRTKRKAFDIVMAVRRLEEEKKILVTEMNHHWKCLSTRADGLAKLSCIVSEPMKGMYCHYCDN